jgi:ornithine decarboxylase
MQKIASDLIFKHQLCNSFYIADLSKVVEKIKQWREYLPMIQPHYAVKCNPDKELLKCMISQNVSFDCASKSEIETVLNLGATDIIYAHPVKSISELKYAYSKNIKHTTFDSVSELIKLKHYAPDLKCILRLKVDNPTARVQLGLKYGAAKDEYHELLHTAKELNIDVVGTSFHVGSYSTEATIFKDAISYSREVLDYAKKLGYNPYLLDIGGGFIKETFKECSDVIKKSIIENNLTHMKIIAEPGRLFAEEFMTFFVNVIGQRKRNNKNEYWISDGLYGSFNCIIYDGQKPIFEVLRNPLDQKHDSYIHFSTCDSLDSFGEVQLPKLNNGDYLFIRNFGAYTLSGSCDFNGINMMHPDIFYIT